MTSFIIPAHNEEQYIGKTIESILKQPTELIDEIIVVDNGSNDRTAEVAKKFEKVRVVREENLGTNFARQRGLEESKSDITAFIDADTLLPKYWLAKVLEILRKPGVIAVSGPYFYYDSGVVFRLFSFYGFLLMAYPIHFIAHTILKRGGVAIGGNLICKRDALINAGGLNTGLRFFGDDADTARRLRTQGSIVFSAKAMVLSSARRFKKHGFLKTAFLYFMNFVWINIFGKPYSH